VLVAKHQALLATQPTNRLIYLFHRIHCIDIFKYSKIRLQLANQILRKIEPVISGHKYDRTIKVLPTRGVTIDLPYDSSLTLSKRYIP
jgi:hypothetical protein